MANTKNTKKKTTSTNSGNKKSTTKKTSTAKKTTNTKKVSTAKKSTTTKKTVPAEKKVTKKVSQPVKSEAKNTSSKKITEKKEEKITPIKEEIVKEEKIEEKASNEKNNIFTIVGISVLIVVIIISCVVTSSKGKYTTSNGDGNDVTTGDATSVESESESIKDEERGELTSISIDEYLEMLKGNEAKIIYIGRPTCSHCAVQKPIMENLVYKYGITINYLNTDELDDDGISKLQSSNDYFSEGWGTPLTLIVKDNDIIDKASGETSSEDLVALFKQYGIISE